MITAVSGFKIGHYTDRTALTGCTVILCPPKTRASYEVRGASPGSRELELLSPEKKMQEVHAILLTGGSAFGLSAADGVMKWLSEHNIGYETPWAKVPIVPGAVIFDLNIGDGTVRPDANAGYAACENATSAPSEEGNIGAGTGATVGKWKGMDTRMKGGFGGASKTVGDIIVGAVAVVNAVGDIIGEDGRILAGARSENGKFAGESDPLRSFAAGKVIANTNTTLVVAATNADFGKIELHRIAQRMHDGMARAIVPAHTSYDGDATFALSCGAVKADFDLVAEIAASVTAEAIRRAVRAAKSAGDVTGLAG
ncbi:MAG: P1 family peptidase [Ignavibacteriae bacterium]|nr:P1 family peptidase [Ignavibacteriota bacterium]